MMHADAASRVGVGAVLSVQDVSLKLGGTKILEGVTFDVMDRVRPGQVTGQVVGLLGPSGVGKTRLLRIIAALDEPDRGVVRGIDGAAVHPGDVGVVFQNYPLLRHRSVEANLVLAGTANGLSRKDAGERARMLLERFGLADRAGLYPMQLSGGQRQRAAIAQQIVVPKKVLLLDEPFSGLDPQVLDEVIRLIVEVAHMHELNTVVIVTHDIWAAMVVSDTLIVLGRDRAGDGRPIPGARVQASIDLVARGLAWQPALDQSAEFAQVLQEIREQFRTL